jgi:hypothetical protein
MRCTTCVAAPSLPSVSVCVTSSSTTAGAVSVNPTCAASRKPSPFGLTVVRSVPSPWNGVDPFDTWTPTSRGVAVRDAAEAAPASSSAASGSAIRRRIP